MSMESAAAFYEKLENDASLMEQLREMTRPEAEKLVKEELHYDFTKEEMQKVIFERHPEMTDEELEVVTGGFNNESEAFLAGGLVAMGALGAAGAAGLFLGAAAVAAA